MSGFLLETIIYLSPYVPDGWQPLGQYLGLSIQMSDRLQRHHNPISSLIIFCQSFRAEDPRVMCNSRSWGS